MLMGKGGVGKTLAAAIAVERAWTARTSDYIDPAHT
jgi:anion-transporting  ArsA/GET3 family ATPase